MRFGSRVWVTRGSSACPPGTPGCLRQRLGTLVGARGQLPVPRPRPYPHCGGEGILCLDTTTGPEPTYRVRCRRLSCGHAGPEDAEALHAVELWGSATYVALTP